MNKESEKLLALQEYRWLSIISYHSNTKPEDAQRLFTEFMGNDLYRNPYVKLGATNVHGPFKIEEISIENYEILNMVEAQKEFEFLLNNPGHEVEPNPLGEVDYQEIIKIYMETTKNCSICYRLRLDPLDETTRSKVHEYCFAIWEFNEFNYIDLDTNRIQTLVFGYD